MRVLNSSEAFKSKYVARVGSFKEAVKAVGIGGAVASGVTGTSAIAVGTAAANASLWSLGAGLPWLGGFCAGKAAAVGTAAGVAALGSAAVLLPALTVGGGVVYLYYRNRKKSSMHKGSKIEELASAFARVACLPMMSLASSVCRSNPANVEPVRDYILKKMGAWGYAESFVRAEFEQAMKHTPAELNSQYEWAMRQLESGSTAGIGATPEELPANVVGRFAEEFREEFDSNLG